jgi:PAS domain S-box-containing protein
MSRTASDRISASEGAPCAPLITIATHAMTLIATGSSLTDILTAIVREVQAEHADTLCSILLLSDDRGHLLWGAAPDLPEFYNAALDGVAIGPAIGSCGTAAFLGERVIVEDIQLDPRWADFRALAAQAGLRSCWSEPVRGADRRVLGTFAIYRRTPSAPSERELRSIEAAAHLAAIAIERKRSEAALSASEARAQRARRDAEAHTQRLKVALRAANAAVVEVDYDEGSTWTSPEFIAVIGQEMNYQEARQAVWPFVHQEDAAVIAAAVKDWLRGVPPETLEVRIIMPDGREKWVSISTEIQKNGAGRWSRTIGLILDIDQRKRQELALIAAEKAALAAAEAKAHFLANMSHEIRTPLNGVLAMAQLMAHGDLDADQREKLDTILQSGHDLLHVINDILDFSKIEAGRFELESIDFDAGAVLESAIASFTPAAVHKNLKLHLDVAADARGPRNGDPARLRQIASNFISNAVKFTAQGGVWIALHGGPGRNELTLSVRDSGLGIAREKMPLLFQSFSQIDASTTRQFGGTGLGLAICRELAALMGGRVWAESEPGLGSSFHATLTLPSVADSAIAETSPPRRASHANEALGLRILAAEDHPTNQIVLSKIMDVFGFDLTLVANGREAVEAWRAGAFDLILMDVQMPEMDGMEATRLIRLAEAEAARPRTPIIALSANAFRHQIEDYMEAGVDAHVAKPIDLAKLQGVIARVFDPADA